MKRGDNIPTIEDYSGWGEEAAAVWYAENRYDMEHSDEPMDGPEDDDWYEPDPFEESFDTYGEALAFMAEHDLQDRCDGVNVTDWGDKWYVEHYSEDAHKAYLRRKP